MLRLNRVSISFVAALVAFLGVSGALTGVANAGSAPNPAPTTSFFTDRFDCNAIRGTDYQSDDERAWFLNNCLGGSSAQSQAPQFTYFLPQDVVVLPPVAAVRPSAPSVRVTCNSSQASVTANEDTQQVPLSALPGEPVACYASVGGNYTSIDWAGGQVNSSGLNTSFVASFGYRTTPWNIRVQVNWGGNPVIKYINVTTVAPGCPLGAFVCYGP